MKNNIKLFFIVLLIICAHINANSQNYTNDMDYVIGDTKQAFISDAITTTEQADNLLQGFINMQVNGIRMPIYAEGLNPNKEMFDYFYTIAVAAGFPIFANPAQSSGGHRIACGVLNTKESLCDVADNSDANDVLINRIKAFALEYKCTWINPFNEDGKTNNPWTASQINTIYASLSGNLNGAELIGSCAWGIPASINVMQNTNIADYITIATTHNLGFNHTDWPTFIALADAENLPVWDSEVNHYDKYETGTRLEAALENKVDGLVLYNSWSTISLTDGSINASAQELMLLYLADYTIPEEPVSIALGGMATQSSTNSTFNKGAELAIDGDTNGNFGGGSVTVTNNEDNPWWQVDLGSEQEIGEIKVFNRTDACCKANMSNITVSVINSAGETTYSKTYTTYPDPSVIADADGALGQIIKIQLNATAALTIAEVQVFAPDVVSTPDVILSIEDNYDINVNIYPNPVSDKLSITMPDAVFEKYSIYDIYGRIMKTGKISTTEFEINVNNFSKGIYILKLEGDQLSKTYKIVKK